MKLSADKMRFIGIDFGTSNSLASAVENGKLEFVKYLDGSRSNPTLLYFPARSKSHFIGSEAVRRYLEHLEENAGGGRLMLSIKTLLPDVKFDYTLVAGHGRVSAEDLAAKFIHALKELAERQFGRKYDGVVLGRPVDFSDLAVERLRKAAEIAGFKRVEFRLEPVAAALAYEMTAESNELICVVDIGGGTSDVCVIETSPSRSFLSDRISDVKAVGGVNLAGDELSAQIMRQQLAPRFGAGSTFVSLGQELPFPAHLIYRLSKWHRINLLNNADDKETIRTILPYSNRQADVQRLFDLIVHHYGYELFEAIDAAKRELSAAETAIVKFKPLELRESISRIEFERIIEPVTRRIEHSIVETLNKANAAPSKIKRVILTGGSSQVPLINDAVIKIFGAEKILRPDFFSSVAGGLGYAASRL